MTDLEMTKRCERAMGWSDIDPEWNSAGQDMRYDPLHNDAQAMALVKKFGLEIKCVTGTWHVWCDEQGVTLSRDLNRAIVECCAKMRAAK